MAHAAVASPFRPLALRLGGSVDRAGCGLAWKGPGVRWSRRAWSAAAAGHVGRTMSKPAFSQLLAFRQRQGGLCCSARSGDRPGLLCSSYPWPAQPRSPCSPVRAAAGPSLLPARHAPTPRVLCPGSDRDRTGTQQPHLVPEIRLRSDQHSLEGTLAPPGPAAARSRGAQHVGLSGLACAPRSEIAAYLLILSELGLFALWKSQTPWLASLHGPRALVGVQPAIPKAWCGLPGPPACVPAGNALRPILAG